MTEPTFQHLAALGSSFASGPGIAPVIDRAAGRSARNYPHLVAEGLGARLTDLSVSGATTANVLDTPQRVLNHTFAPQLDGLPADADLVTITVGGNDLGNGLTTILAGVAGRLLSPIPVTGLGSSLVRRFRPARGEDVIDRATTTLVQIIDTVRTRTGGARVLVVGYLTIFGDDSRPGPELPFDAAAIDDFRRRGEQVQELLGRAAAKSGADFIDVGAASRSHAVGSPDPWVLGMTPIRSVLETVPYHPNAAGMAAVADIILTHLRTSRP